jgi:GH24 family phage-related lysozyme (muramidase)
MLSPDAFNYTTLLNEGEVATPYKDTRQIPTIGRGFNMNERWTQENVRKSALSGDIPLEPQEILDLSNKRYDIAVQEAFQWFGDTWYKMTPDQRTVAVDMFYQMGGPRTRKFTDFKKAIEKGDIEEAIKEIEDSNYYRAKDTHERAKKSINRFRSNPRAQAIQRG